MSPMIRKQVYIQKRQQIVLQRLARRRGVSESKVIRQAIDQLAQSAASQPLPPDPLALETIIQFALGRRKLGAAGEPYRWQREDAYEDRDQRLAPPAGA